MGNHRKRLRASSFMAIALPASKLNTLVSLLPLIVVLGVCSAQAAPATPANPRLLEVRRTNSFGGNGGGPFEISCPYGTVMTGLKARHGAWIDAVSPVCAKFVNGRVFGEIPHEIFTGGGGGGPGFMRCEGPRGVVTALQMFKANNEDGSVGHIIIECGNYLNPAAFNNKLPGSADYLGNSMLGQRLTVRCSPPMVAGGIFGLWRLCGPARVELCELPAEAIAARALKGPLPYTRCSARAADQAARF
jgi:hypothetical protein